MSLRAVVGMARSMSATGCRSGASLSGWTVRPLALNSGAWISHRATRRATLSSTSATGCRLAVMLSGLIRWNLSPGLTRLPSRRRSSGEGAPFVRLSPLSRPLQMLRRFHSLSRLLPPGAKTLSVSRCALSRANLSCWVSSHCRLSRCSSTGMRIVPGRSASLRPCRPESRSCPVLTACCDCDFARHPGPAVVRCPSGSTIRWSGARLSLPGLSRSVCRSFQPAC